MPTPCGGSPGSSPASASSSRRECRMPRARARGIRVWPATVRWSGLRRDRRVQVDLVLADLPVERRPRDPEEVARLPLVTARAREGALDVFLLDLVERGEARDGLGGGLDARGAGVAVVHAAELEVV